MAETISELLVKIGADVTEMRSAVATVESYFGQIQKAGTTTSEALNQEFSEGLFEGLADEARQVANSIQGIGDKANQLKNLDFGRAFEGVGRGIEQFQQLEKVRLTRVSAEVAQLSSNIVGMARAGEVGIVGVQQLAINVTQLASAAGLAGPRLAGITSSMLALGAAAAGVAAVGRLVADGLSRMAESERALGDTIVRISDSSKGIAEINKILDSVRTDRAQAETHTYAEETEALVTKIRRLGAEHGVAQGQIEAEVAALRTNRQETILLAEAADRAAEAKRRQAAAGAALVDRAQILSSIEIPVPEDTLKALNQLRAELDFDGPVSQLQALQAEIEGTEKALRDAAKAAGQDPLGEAVEQDVASATEKLKERFKANVELDLQVDPSAAKAEVDRFLSDTSAGPGVKLSATFELQQALTQLDLLRSRILDTPEGELKIALRAEAGDLEERINEIRQRQEEDDITVPVDVDTSAAAEHLRQFADTLSAEFSEVADLLSPVGDAIQTIGDVATGADVAATAFTLMQDAAQALATGDLLTMRDLLFSANQFVESFGDGLRLVGDNRTLSALHEIEGVIAALTQRVGTLNVSLPQLATQLRAVGEASGSIQFDVTASGSPTLPFTEYFEQHVPSVLAGIEAPSLTMPVAVEPDFAGFDRALSSRVAAAPTVATAVATGASAVDLTRTNELLTLNLQKHQEAIDGQWSAVKAIAGLGSALGSGRFVQGVVKEAQTVIRQQTGNRGFKFG